MLSAGKCRKRWFSWPVTTGNDNQSSQSNFEANTCNLRVIGTIFVQSGNTGELFHKSSFRIHATEMFFCCNWKVFQNQQNWLNLEIIDQYFDSRENDLPKSLHCHYMARLGALINSSRGRKIFLFLVPKNNFFLPLQVRAVKLLFTPIGT